ncbi:MAG: prephenate dehydratase [Candidatus Latescibacterota bacterium]|nr:MAG: prephenate dehydratase [Candidatus Latescibacterota bacterium]RKY73965.1 MAG: prephenate dehydratase [Candidatus Latescibacterota bacterium]
MDKLRIAFQGELGAYSELAAREFFSQPIMVRPLASFEEVFNSVESRDCSHGVVPIENSLTGSIHENYDLLLAHNLFITGEIKLRIVHNLIVNPGVRLEQIKRVYSHPQALSQCKNFIRSLRTAEPVPVYDTAAAVRLVKTQDLTDAAAIASAQAAIDYGLVILKSEIEDNHKNFTRFIIISPERGEMEGDCKTSIVFSTQNIPGALFKSLSVFALRDINLLKIESRPLHGNPWQYLFYLDFDGSLQQARCQRAIEDLKEITTLFRVLGSYPKGKQIQGKLHKR